MGIPLPCSPLPAWQHPPSPGQRKALGLSIFRPMGTGTPGDGDGALQGHFWMPRKQASPQSCPSVWLMWTQSCRSWGVSQPHSPPSGTQQGTPSPTAAPWASHAGLLQRCAAISPARLGCAGSQALGDRAFRTGLQAKDKCFLLLYAFLMAPLRQATRLPAGKPR